MTNWPKVSILCSLFYMVSAPPLPCLRRENEYLAGCHFFFFLRARHIDQLHTPSKTTHTHAALMVLGKYRETQLTFMVLGTVRGMKPADLLLLVLILRSIMSPVAVSMSAIAYAPEKSRSSCRVNSEQRSSNFLDCRGHERGGYHRTRSKGCKNVRFSRNY